MTKNGLNIAGALLAALLVVGTFVHFHHPPPSPADFDGTYSNPCCSAVQLRDGYLTTAGSTARIRYVHDKFGVAGYLASPVGQLYVPQDGKKAASTLVFSSDLQQFSTVDSSGKERIFRKAAT